MFKQLEIKNLRCFEVMLYPHDVACVFECPSLLDIQLGDHPSVFVPRFGHHLEWFCSVLLFFQI